MYISKVKLNNFRNFKNSIIKFNEKSLIIGPNDIGKTNLVHALRLLLDKSLSYSDIEPKDTDFNVDTDLNKFKITVIFSKVTEDCVLSAFKGSVSDDGQLVLGYVGSRDVSGKKEFEIFAGRNEDELVLQSQRHYLKYLNLEYVRSSRDLMSYVKKEKKKLFEVLKADRSEKEVNADILTVEKIQQQLENINSDVKKLSYIKKSISQINTELVKLTPENESIQLGFDSGALNPEEYIENVDLVSESNGKKVSVGGDGRSNQIFLSMWSSRKDNVDVEEVTLYCIEEPEAHLHPHNQRNLAYYLYEKLKGQVIITTHSPQIACEFSPNSIIKLFRSGKFSTKAASQGCSKRVSDAFEQFNYRLNLLPAEGFFSNSVLLVEGPSEVLFYKALAKALEIELDRLSISILSVNGVDFEPYFKIFHSLAVPVLMRTDNDIFKVSSKNGETFRLAGVERCLSLAESFFPKNEGEEYPCIKDANKRFDTAEEARKSFKGLKELLNDLEENLLFISKTDLENDLATSEIQEELFDFYNVDSVEKLVKKMQESKGLNMFEFLSKHYEVLAKLKDNPVAAPLLRAKEIACNDEK